MASLVSSSPSPNPLLPSSQPDLPSMPSPSPRSPSPSSPPDPPSNPNPSPSPAPTAEPSSVGRRQRLPRACTSRSRAREVQPPPPPPERRRREKTEDTGSGSSSRVVTPLVPDPVPADVPLFNLRSMWQLASVLNFLHVFRSLLNIAAEFTSEELESALLSPNNILDDIHMPMLKSIPPVTRMGMARGTWVTVLCRKLRDWWHWVGEGEVPIVADHGAENEAYKILDPAARLMILKAICDIRVEQEDIRNYIDHSLKRGAQLSLFRKDRIGGDAFGISYWYEDDPVLGHRLYREIRKVETPKLEGKKPDTKKRKGRPPPPPPPIVTYQWETVATNLDEFQEVSDKLFGSKNRTEVSLAKKLKIDYLPEIEKTHQMNIALMQKKEKLLKKQQREALLLNSYLTADGATSGRSLRNRKNVTYTFDDYDRSINEAIKLTKRSQESPEPAVGTSSRKIIARHEASANGQSNGPSSLSDHFCDAASPKSEEDNDAETDREGEPDGPLDRSNRQRKRPQKYSEDFVDAAAYDVNANFDSDDDIVGEVVYDEEYLKTRKNKSASSGSEGDEEYKLDDEEEDEENLEEDEYVEEEEDSVGSSEEELEMNHRTRRIKKESLRSKRGARKLRSFDDIETGLRRSKRATRPKINYRKYELSESDTNSDADADVAYSENDQEVSTSSQDRNEEAGEEMEDDDDYNNNYNNNDNHNNYDNNGGTEVMNEEYTDIVAQEQKQESLDKERSPCEEKEDSLPRRFLDLNDPAPDMGFDDGPNMSVKDEDMDDS